MKPKLTFHRTTSGTPYWVCSESGKSYADSTPQGAFAMWAVLSAPLTEKQLQKARKALARLAYDFDKISEAAESLLDIAIMCGKNLK